jgi:ATP-dependent DNA ligase
MLKRAASPYTGGRKRGDWWKWKLDPFTVDAVMIYAQGGHGRRAGLYTDFTFAVRDGDALVPFAKAYSGLTDAEFAEITAWVQAHTLERSAPCAGCRRNWCSRSPSRASRPARATNPASRCDFRGSRAGGRTSR